MNLIKKLFGTKTNYPKQTIPPKALQLINEIDSYLVSNATSGDNFTLVQLTLDIVEQYKSVDSLLNLFKLQFKGDYAYAPRSIAFVINANGQWQLFIGIRRIYPSTIESITIDMWVDLLNRTNSARI
jgi:hypothetical protein